jgi:hypothetical protein
VQLRLLLPLLLLLLPQVCAEEGECAQCAGAGDASAAAAGSGERLLYCFVEVAVSTLVFLNVAGKVPHYASAAAAEPGGAVVLLW